MTSYNTGNGKCRLPLKDPSISQKKKDSLRFLLHQTSSSQFYCRTNICFEIFSAIFFLSWFCQCRNWHLSYLHCSLYLQITASSWRHLQPITANGHSLTLLKKWHFLTTISLLCIFKCFSKRHSKWNVLAQTSHLYFFKAPCSSRWLSSWEPVEKLLSHCLHLNFLGWLVFIWWERSILLTNVSSHK